MAIIRDTNLWIAEIEGYEYYEQYESVLSPDTDNSFNWVIKQEILGVLLSMGYSSQDTIEIVDGLTDDYIYLPPDVGALKVVSEVYEKCRVSVDTKQDVKDVYIAGYAVFHKMPVVTHDLEFSRLQIYEPRLEIITNRAGKLRETHPRKHFSPNIDELDDYMYNNLQKREKEMLLI